MDMKYANVGPVDEIVGYLDGLTQRRRGADAVASK
jgi:hypothetical protein